MRASGKCSPPTCVLEVQVEFEKGAFEHGAASSTSSSLGAQLRPRDAMRPPGRSKRAATTAGASKRIRLRRSQWGRGVGL